jgi:hypothetical protein
MHVNAIGAAIDLRGAELNQMIQIFFEPTIRKVFFEAEHGREKPRGNLAIINSWFHSFFSLGSWFQNFAQRHASLSDDSFPLPL